MSPRSLTLPIACFFLPAFLLPEEAKPPAPKLDFVRDIQPVFEKHCFKCHSAEKQKAGYRLDVKEIALNGGDSGKSAIVPGKSAKSPLFKFIFAADPEKVMPPKGELLSAPEIELIKTWIDQGAIWPDGIDNIKPDPRSQHWAFQVAPRLPVPAVKDKSWTRNAVDFFILAHLEQQNIKPSPETNRYKLIRRLSLDLLGLPPKPEEIDSFINDKSPDAWAKLVQRILDSPHFGERWGRHWLDLARYADSDGYEKDRSRPNAWRWRNWVIDAINRDVPFDQFTAEQLAGDLLPNATLEQKVATGFHRNTLTNREGGIDREEDRVKQTVDRTNTTATVWLGLTFGCAQCHSHKYDPISQREYYKLYSFFNSAAETDIAAPLHWELAAFKTAKKSWDKEYAKIKAEFAEAAKKYEKEQLPARQAEWEAKVMTATKGWTVLDPVELTSAGGATFVKQKDRSYLLTNKRPPKDTYTIVAETDMTGITGIRLEVFPDKSLGGRGPGRANHGNFVLSEIKLVTQALNRPLEENLDDFEADKEETANAPSLKEATGLTKDEKPAKPAGFAKPSVKPAKELRDPAVKNAEQNVAEKAEEPSDETTEKKPQSIELRNATADYSQKGWPVANSVDGKLETGWAVSNRFGKPHQAYYELIEDVGFKGGTKLTFTLIQNYGGEHTIGRFRISATTAPRPIRYGKQLSKSIATIIMTPKEKRSRKQRIELAKYYRNIDTEFQKLNRSEREHKKKEPKFPGTKAQALVKGKTARETRIHIRGDFLRKGAKVNHGTPAVLHFFKAVNGKPTRLDLAQWLMAADNPLTARVAVNRIWQHLFGAGLVTTTDDFGLRGEKPSYPNLLDWLAHEYRARKWSRKEMIKLIVQSAAYRQESLSRPELEEIDPKNRFLARQNRFRMEAEIVRDVSLAAGGLMSEKVGGPSIRPPLPGDIAKLGYANSVRWATSSGEDKYRRGLYIFFQRTVPYPMLMTFDSPDSNNTCTRRERSNTPIQALTLLNDPVFVECAQALGRKIFYQGPNEVKGKIEYLYKVSLSREPTRNETGDLQQFIREGTKQFKRDKEAASKLVNAKMEDGQLAEAATWVAAARVFLNLDEFITRE